MASCGLPLMAPGRCECRSGASRLCIFHTQKWICLSFNIWMRGTTYWRWTEFVAIWTFDGRYLRPCWHVAVSALLRKIFSFCPSQSRCVRLFGMSSSTASRALAVSTTSPAGTIGSCLWYLFTNLSSCAYRNRVAEEERTVFCSTGSIQTVLCLWMS